MFSKVPIVSDAVCRSAMEGQGFKGFVNTPSVKYSILNNQTSVKKRDKLKCYNAV